MNGAFIISISFMISLFVFPNDPRVIIVTL